MVQQNISFSQQSRILDKLRFPLACMVVVIHCKINQGGWVLPQWSNFTYSDLSVVIQILFSTILSGIAVPTFYLMSGYFFFYKIDVFDSNVYRAKLKKRISTLLVPYLLWNLLFILKIVIFKVAAYIVKGKPLSNIVDYFNENGWLRMFWDCNIWSLDKINILGWSIPPTGPILIPMWFIRDLMVVVLITPIIYILIRKFKLWTVFVLGICYVTGIWPYLHGFSITALFFFSVGAYFSINKQNMVNELRKYMRPALFSYIPFTILMVYLNGDHTLVGDFIYPFYIIVGVVAIINLFLLLEKKGKLENLNSLSETTFFIYAFHGLIGITIADMILDIPFPIADNNYINVIMHYLLMPILTIGTCLITFHMMMKYCPCLLNVLTGKRV